MSSCDMVRILHQSKVLERLGRWAIECAQALTPLVGVDRGWALVDSAFCEAIGRLLDEGMSGAANDPAGDPQGRSSSAPSRSEIMEFFQRFWGMSDMTRDRRVLNYSKLDIERLRELQNSLCASLVTQYPATFGRYGRETLARDWRMILGELPRISDALAQLEGTTDGVATYERFAAGLGNVLEPIATQALGIQALFRFRTIARERLNAARVQVRL